MSEKFNEDLIKKANAEGWKMNNTLERKPFIDWNEKPEIEGIVSNVRKINGKFGEQTICDIGDYSINCTTALSCLEYLTGYEVKIIYIGNEISSNGNQFKNFAVMTK